MPPGGNDDEGAARMAVKGLLRRAGFVAAVLLVASGAGCAAGHSSSSTAASSTAPKQPDLSGSGTPGTSPPGTTTTTLATTTQPTTPVIVTPQGGSVRQPTTMSMGGAHNLQITGITWSSWGSSSAQGTGSETASSCNPTCAAGGQVTMVISLTLSQPQNGMFTFMTQQDNAGNPPSTWTYPSLWPVAAS